MRELALPDVFQALEPGEPVESLERVADRLYVAHGVKSWVEFARWGSVCTPGLWMPRDDGVCWANGAQRLWFVSRPAVGPILEALELVRRFGLEAGPSFGSMGGVLARWLDRPVTPMASTMRLLREWPVPIQHVIPGAYDAQHLVDVRACYWSLFCRLPSLRVHVLPGPRVVFGHERPAVSERRDLLARVIGHNKRLRNCVVSACHGALGERTAFHRGERMSVRGRPGPFRGAGLLVMRSAAELLYHACMETDAVLSNTDCVVCDDARWPTIFESAGLTVERRAVGDAECCNVISYRVGGYSTGWYARGSRLRARQALPRPPSVWMSGYWLGVAC